MSSSVAVVDYIDPLHPGNQTLLQPILISSRRSCHEEGNEYLQTGNHDFEFSLFSHSSGWQHGFQQALGANEKLFTILDPKPYQSASLPEELSFFSTNSADLVITAIKMQEDGAGTSIRVVNLGDESKTLELKSFKGINSCSHADLLEYPIKALPFSNSSFKFIIGKAGIETFIVR
jgi:alpha-mannosidase